LRPLSRAALALALPALLAVPASGEVTQPKLANLDGDPDLEQVIPQEVPAPYPQRRIVVSDTCNGAPYSRVVSSEQDAVVALKVANLADITPRPEIFFDLRSGAGARVGEIRIVSWEDGPTAGACPQARDLFRYPSKRTRGRVPRKAEALSSFAAALRNVSKRYAGKELRLYEYYVDRNDPLCCASFKRTTDFGYSAGKDLYVEFRTRVRRIRR
jgi:hypothetical protein